MEITRAQRGELDELMPVYDLARGFMRRTGNLEQWADGYPWRDLIAEDIEKGRAYVCREQGRIAAVFTFSVEEEPNYREIREGAWLNDRPYGVVHRLASAGIVSGVGRTVLDWCFLRCGNVRIDTYPGNRVMQSLLERNGFVRCGVVTIENGADCIAYQKTAVLP